MIKWYTIYNPNTGEIVGVFNDDGKTVELNTPAGMQVVEGKYDDKDGYIENNQFVEKPVQPDPNYVFDWITKTWIDPRTLADLKATKWIEIKAIRDLKEFGGFVFNGLEFDSDATSQQRIMGAVQLAQLDPNYTVTWTLKDNTTTNLTNQNILDLGTALGNYVTQLHTTSQNLRTLIEQATTKDQLDSIVWP